jgi:hypothetical protein
MILLNFVQDNQTQFAARVKAIAAEIGINPNWLMGVMYKESRLNHQARNPISGATGLIQFMPDTAAAMGTTTTALAAMTNVQQLEFVRGYLLPYRNKINSFEDTYFAVFFPAAIGKPDDYVLQTSRLSAALIATQNPAMDYNKDKKITVAEVKQWLYSGFDPEIQNQLKKKVM